MNMADFPWRTQLVASDEVDTARVEEIRTIEAALSRVSATQSAVKAVEKPTSWWTSIGTRGWGPVNGNTKTKEDGTAVTKSSSQDTNNIPQKLPTENEAISKRLGFDIKDTVVGKLADRAASDPDLKSVLEAVASGKASTDQLKKFQVHLDELTRS
jgi:hypothetical protein